MANTRLKFSQMVEDIKSSWYFRFWLVLWIPCFLLAFICLIILGNISRKNQHHEDTKVWWENTSYINYPQFHFRLPENEGSIAGINCVYDQNQQLHTQLCEPWHGQVPDISQCIAVASASYGVGNSFKDSPWQETIQCNVTAISPKNVSLLMAWEIEDPQTNIDVGGNAAAAIWVAPTTNAQIQLFKSVTTWDKKPLNLWYRNLVYHSTVSVLSQYSVTIQIAGFGVFHYEKMSMFNPWQAVGDIGGFAFFVGLAHTAAMIIIGLVMSNSSTFLNQSNASGVGGNIHDNNGAYTKM